VETRKNRTRHGTKIGMRRRRILKVEAVGEERERVIVKGRARVKASQRIQRRNLTIFLNQNHLKQGGNMKRGKEEKHSHRSNVKNPESLLKLQNGQKVDMMISS
jgi:hypothetical protein